MGKQTSVFINLFSLASLLLLAACTGLLNTPGPGNLQTATPSGGTALPAINTSIAGPTLSATTALPATSTPAAGPTMSIITALPATSQPLGTHTPMAQPGNQPTATPKIVSTAPAGQELNVTLANDGQTVKLKAGQRFLLNLGADYDWISTVADESIVSRVIGILVIRGAQGVYEAHAPGSTSLIATGNPTCLKSKPACAMPSRLFKVTITVEP
jgi:hypothetical protein